MIGNLPDSLNPELKKAVRQHKKGNAKTSPFRDLIQNNII